MNGVSPSLPAVDGLEGKELPNLPEINKSTFGLLCFFVIQWSRAWGFTTRTTVVHFISSLSLNSNSTLSVSS
jgi:hypothetical protein